MASSLARRAALLGCLLLLAAAAAQAAEPSCPEPCWVVGDYYPFSTCKSSCDKEVCDRGYQVYKSRELCCTPGLAFPGGCTQRPSECWVVEDNNAHTCRRDDRKCLQGYGVFASEKACCEPGAAFKEGCAQVTPAESDCFVVDTYYPARACRATRTLCNLKDKGVQSWPSKEACCGPNGAFGQQGCSTYVPVSPCWTIDSYYPERKCARTEDVAVCNRGWGAYGTEEVCCTPGAAFNEGCSRPAADVKVTAAAAEMGQELVALPEGTAAAAEPAKKPKAAAAAAAAAAKEASEPAPAAAKKPKAAADLAVHKAVHSHHAPAPEPEVTGKHSSSTKRSKVSKFAPAPEPELKGKHSAASRKAAEPKAKPTFG